MKANRIKWQDPTPWLVQLFGIKKEKKEPSAGTEKQEEKILRENPKPQEVSATVPSEADEVKEEPDVSLKPAEEPDASLKPASVSEIINNVNHINRSINAKAILDKLARL